MKIKLMLSIFVVLLLCVSVIDTQVYMGKGNIFIKSFSEPFEKTYFIFYNGDFISFTTKHEEGVFVLVSRVKDFLEKEGKEVKDIAIVMHNHLVPTPFSPQDLKTLSYLKEHGFTGSYCIYFNGTGKIIKYNEK